MRRKSRKFRKPNIYTHGPQRAASGRSNAHPPGPQVPSKNFVIFCKIFSKILINQLDLRKNTWIISWSKFLFIFRPFFEAFLLHITAYFVTVSATVLLYSISDTANRAESLDPQLFAFYVWPESWQWESLSRIRVLIWSYRFSVGYKSYINVIL